jgi:hypothetical protein
LIPEPEQRREFETMCRELRAEFRDKVRIENVENALRNKCILVSPREVDYVDHKSRAKTVKILNFKSRL